MRSAELWTWSETLIQSWTDSEKSPHQWPVPCCALGWWRTKLGSIVRRMGCLWPWHPHSLQGSNSMHCHARWGWCSRTYSSPAGMAPAPGLQLGTVPRDVHCPLSFWWDHGLDHWVRQKVLVQLVVPSLGWAVQWEQGRFTPENTQLMELQSQCHNHGKNQFQHDEQDQFYFPLTVF